MPNTTKVVLLLETSREYGRKLLFGITKYSYFHGPWAFHWKTGGRDRILPQLDLWGATGIIAHVSSQKKADEIIESGIPAVIKGLDGTVLPLIKTDDAAIGKMGAEHLLERGFKNFAFCGYHDTYWSTNRQKYFTARLNEDGFEPFIYDAFGKPNITAWEDEQTHLADWLMSLPKPIGIMAPVDDRSINVIEACKIADIDVPNDVAIIGVDNDELVCQLAKPQLSSIALAAERAGFEAAELLGRLMQGEKMQGQQILTVPTHVETRQSTDILAIEDREIAQALQFIRQHPNEPLQVSDVVDAVAISRRSLQLRFKQALGRSILDEIRKVRIEQVSRMLTETNLPVSNIAMSLGFPGIDHIARFFRKEKKMSPLTYRKRYGKH
ncbi:MAG: DNA-binding transcriptional regulator [Phycisphaerae bacterium]|nr:DNA-binding transcriptional regulator [Phycisphaerae bacterium]